MRLSILLAVLLFAAATTGCKSITNTVTGNNNNLCVNQPQTISTNPSLQADGNSIPASIVP